MNFYSPIQTTHDSFRIWTSDPWESSIKMFLNFRKNKLKIWMIRMRCELDCIFKKSRNFRWFWSKIDENRLKLLQKFRKIVRKKLKFSQIETQRSILLKFCEIFGDFGPKNVVKKSQLPEILEKRKKIQLSEKYSHIFDENFAKFSVISVIFGCQIHEEPFFRFQVQIKAGALFSIFPPILNFQKMVKIYDFSPKKICKSWNSVFMKKNIIVSVKKLTFFFWIGVFLISRFSFFYSALFFCRWLSLFWEDNG